MIRIMGAWTGFRVVLNPKDRLVPVGNRRHGPVIQIEMGDVNRVLIQRISGQGKTMVLTGDLNLACGAAGVIQTTMAIGEFEGLAAESQAKNLMPQTDPKQGEIGFIQQ